MARTHRIVVFGATGYTGELVSRALAARGVQPVLAGRSQSKLEDLAADLGDLRTAVADVSRPESVRALVERGDVLISTVGPFVQWGAAAVEAAVDAGAHYVDSTGEPAFIRKVFEGYGPRAARSGSTLLTAFGYDWVPGNLAAGMALRDAGPDAVRVDIGYFTRGGAISGGTRASSALAALEPSFAFRSGELRTARVGGRTRAFVIAPGKKRLAFSVGGSEHFGLPGEFPQLREVNVMLAGAGATETRLMPLATLGLAAARRVPPLHDGLSNLVRDRVQGSTGGPDEASRARSSSLVIAEAFAASGELLHRTRLEGVNAYTFTGDMLAWAATELATGSVERVGAQGPVGAFGLGRLEEGLRSAGITATA